MSAELVLYPRLMWSPGGVEVTAADVDAEVKYLAEGYRLTPEAPAVEAVEEAVLEVPPADPENEPPTFGAADDDTFAEADKPKKAAKKK